MLVISKTTSLSRAKIFWHAHKETKLRRRNNDILWRKKTKFRLRRGDYTFLRCKNCKILKLFTLFNPNVVYLTSNVHVSSHINKEYLAQWFNNANERCNINVKCATCISIRKCKFDVRTWCRRIDNSKSHAQECFLSNRIKIFLLNLKYRDTFLFIFFHQRDTLISINFIKRQIQGFGPICHPWSMQWNLTMTLSITSITLTRFVWSSNWSIWHCLFLIHQKWQTRSDS